MPLRLSSSRRILAAALAGIVLLVSPTVSLAQGVNTSFGFLLTSPDVPDLDATGRLPGVAGAEPDFTAYMTVSSAGIAANEEGPQGWSCGVWYAGFELVDFTTRDTASARRADGGIVDNSEEDGFVVFEEIDPLADGNRGRNGIVQAVVLSFRLPLFLPKNSIQIVGRLDFRVSAPDTAGFIRFTEHLVGSGQPVDNEITVDGGSTSPSLGARDVIAGDASPEAGPDDCDNGIDDDGDGLVDADDPGCSPRPIEDCGDGVDNDGDGAVDCDDAQCIGIPPCESREICRGGTDDDGDGLADCDDPDCTADPACRVPETCDDGVDNDDDGDIDCDDPECRGIGDCPAPERCDNGEDDDLDGLVDCEDPECRATRACRDGFIENCRDGIDNDLDGSIDCEDRDCARDRSCDIAEICDDGVDNDFDGAVDCQDSECRGLGDCPPLESCDNGRDDDGDGLIDCDDPDCSFAPRCRRRGENCRDGFDNDIDGLTDCDDPDCDDSAICPPREICDNARDDDGDGLVDCEDPSCETIAPCEGAGRGFDLVLAGAGARRQDGQDGEGAGGVGSVSRNVVEVAGDVFDIVTFIVPFPVPQSAGAQGWSLAVAHDGDVLDVTGPPTIDGTDAGELVSGGFVVNDEVDDNVGAGAGGSSDGVVSAVVLSFTMPITLDPAAAQSVLRATYRFRTELGPRRHGSIRFQDGLVGNGQPVGNIITVEGQSSVPVHRIAIEAVPVASYVRGDPNDDGRANIADAVWMLNELMRGGPETTCLRAADVNNDGEYNVADPVYLVQYRFLDGPTIPPPHPGCGGELADGTGELPCPLDAAAACR